jgi:diketogulonate reductase-like aldo/keto reductase
METAFINVQLPINIYHRLEQAAIRLQKPVLTLLTDTLQAALPKDNGVPQSFQSDMASLEALDTRQLHVVAKSEMNLEAQDALEQLLDLAGMQSTGVSFCEKHALLRYLLNGVKLYHLNVNKIPCHLNAHTFPLIFDVK